MTSAQPSSSGPEQQPEEHRDAEQPQHREGVGQGPDPVGQVLAVHDRRAIRRRDRERAADGPFDDVTAPPARLHTVPRLVEGPARPPRRSQARGEPLEGPAGAAQAGTATEAGAGS